MKAWSLLVVRILNYKLGSFDSTVNTYVPDENSTATTYIHNKKNVRTIFSKNIQTNVSTISAKYIAMHIYNTVENIGVNVLGFCGDKTGTHSVRTSFAMLLYLQRVHPFTIMLQGCRSSEAFLL